MELEPTDHSKLAESRLASEFKYSLNLIAYVKILLSEANLLESTFIDVIEKRWLNNAKGKELDIIGEIVGQKRSIGVAIEQPKVDLYFGFAGYVYSNSFGSVNDPLLGKRFIGLDEFGDIAKVLSDEVYLKLIKARITRNYTTSSIEDIISHIKFIFGAELIQVKELNINNGIAVHISIGKILSDDDKDILKSNIMVKPAGIPVVYTTEFDHNSFFAFTGVPGAKGFGSVNDPTPGGVMGNLIF